MTNTYNVYNRLLELNEKNKKDCLSSCCKENIENYKYTLEINNDRIYLYKLNGFENEKIEIKSLLDIVLIIKPTPIFITNISLLKGKTKILSRFELNNGIGYRLFGKLRALKNLDLLEFKKVTNLKSELGKITLLGGKLLLNFYDEIIVIQRNNNVYVLTETTLVIPRSFKFNFSGFSFKKLRIDNMDLSNVVDMHDFLSDCIYLEKVELLNFNTINVVNMRSFFAQCKSLKEIDLSFLNTINVTEFDYMFFGCESLEILDLNCLDMRNCESCYKMFSNCTNLRKIDMKNCKSYRLYTIDDMFSYCDKLKYVDMRNFLVNFKLVNKNRLGIICNQDIKIIGLK